MQISTIRLFLLDVTKNIEKTAPKASLVLQGALQGSPKVAERVQKGGSKIDLETPNTLLLHPRELLERQGRPGTLISTSLWL